MTGGGRKRVGISLLKNRYEPEIIRDPNLKSLNPKFTHCPSQEILIIFAITPPTTALLM